MTMYVQKPDHVLATYRRDTDVMQQQLQQL